MNLINLLFYVHYLRSSNESDIQQQESSFLLNFVKTNQAISKDNSKNLLQDDKVKDELNKIEEKCHKANLNSPSDSSETYLTSILFSNLENSIKYAYNNVLDKYQIQKHLYNPLTQSKDKFQEYGWTVEMNNFTITNNLFSDMFKDSKVANDILEIYKLEILNNGWLIKMINDKNNTQNKEFILKVKMLYISKIIIDRYFTNKCYRKS